MFEMIETFVTPSPGRVYLYVFQQNSTFQRYFNVISTLISTYLYVFQHDFDIFHLQKSLTSVFLICLNMLKSIKFIEIN